MWAKIKNFRLLWFRDCDLLVFKEFFVIWVQDCVSIAVPSSYLQSEMVGTCMLMAYLSLRLRSLDPVASCDSSAKEWFLHRRRLETWWPSSPSWSNHWDAGLVVCWTDVRYVKLLMGISHLICRFQNPFYHFCLCKITQDNITDLDMLCNFQCDHAASRVKASADFPETLRLSTWWGIKQSVHVDCSLPIGSLRPNIITIKTGMPGCLSTFHDLT